ncbi:DUF262 domain-containing protein [Sinorhizobium meliloti]|uniref:DUF262 domain-containing protein n=1 Tax=Rhizobium meliloti TaxID=382 RepID=UPI0003825771|nr:DUF262 domain-containing protein [Sinorhizobium meliloti]
MPIKPTQLGVKFLFEQNHTFVVPKYQRGYAWDEDAINDFIEDLSRCLKVRQEGSEKSHFFGGVVTVRNPLANSNRSNYEVIDGQQRLASFVMFVAAVVRGMRNIVGDLTKKGSLSAEEKKAKKFLEDTIDTLRATYLVYRDEIDLEYVEIPKLKLSDSDNEFFQNVTAEKNSVAKRASHARIQAAWHRLTEFVENELLKSGSPWEKAKRLQLLVNSVLATDCSVIFMCSETRSEAYQIFQVLNDRGVHLTDGDLLRASTLELLDSKSLSTIQNKLSERWDSVLAYAPGDIDSYLRWYYSSHEGKRPKSSNLADQFLEFRFKSKDKSSANKVEAQAVLEEVERIDKEFATLQTLCDGEWPFEDHSQVKSWDRERLRMLVTHLKHTNAMPLLLSLIKLEPQKFAEAVSTLERFVFRFKTIGNAHIAPMTDLYLRHAKKIRGNPNHAINDLRKDLKELIDRAVPDSVFETNLSEVRYSKRSGNGHIRYLLITLEDYAQWYAGGASGVPRCKDKTRVFDFSNTTLEHVYPRSAKDDEKEASLEKVKDTLGNLTIFGPSDNDAAANKTFAEKRSVLQSSNLKLNRDIGANSDWTSDKVQQRAQSLVSMALKVFVP